MPKCWIHGQTAKTETPKPLKTHPGFPDLDFKKDLNLLLKSPLSWNKPSKSYVYYELNEAKQKLKTIKDNEAELSAKQKELAGIKNFFEAEKLVLKQETNKLENKLNQLIARILNISEKPTGTFDPELIKQKGIKELLERYKVNSLEELVNFVDSKPKIAYKSNQELEDFLNDNQVSSLHELQTLIIDLERKVNELKERSQFEEQSREVPEDYASLETERDELARDKKTLEQETLSLSNKLKNKSQEVQNKVEAIERLKKENNQSVIALNKTISDLRSELTKSQEEKTNQMNDEEKDWRNISLSLDDKQKKRWIESGFTYESCKEWIDIGMKTDGKDFAFSAWLRDTKKLTPIEVLNYENKGELRREWERAPKKAPKYE